MKHISKQGPVYIRSVIDVPGEDLQGWLGDKVEDESSDNGTLMKPAFKINDEKKAGKSTTAQVPVEVIDDDVELFNNHSNVSKSTMPSR